MSALPRVQPHHARVVHAVLLEHVEMRVAAVAAQHAMAERALELHLARLHVPPVEARRAVHSARTRRTGEPSRLVHASHCPLLVLVLVLLLRGAAAAAAAAARVTGLAACDALLSLLVSNAVGVCDIRVRSAALFGGRRSGRAGHSSLESAQPASAPQLSALAARRGCLRSVVTRSRQPSPRRRWGLLVLHDERCESCSIRSGRSAWLGLPVRRRGQAGRCELLRAGHAGSDGSPQPPGGARSHRKQHSTPRHPSFLPFRGAAATAGTTLRTAL